MRTPRISAEEIRTIGLRIKEAEGRVSVARLMQEVGGGGYQRISVIAREINQDVQSATTLPSAANVPDSGEPEALPTAVRDGLIRLEEAIAAGIRRAGADADQRARAAEHALRSAHEVQVAALRSEREALEGYLAEMDTALGEAAEARAEAEERERTLEARCGEMEARLREEQAERTSERQRLEEAVHAARAAERQSMDVRHAAELARTRADADLQAAREALATEREERRTMAARAAELQVRLAGMERALDAAGASVGPPKQLLATRLKESVRKPRSRRTSTAHDTADG